MQKTAIYLIFINSLQNLTKSNNLLLIYAIFICQIKPSILTVSGSTVSLIDLYSTSDTTPPTDSSQDYTLISYQVGTSSVSTRFSRKLSTGDSKDKTLIINIIQLIIQKEVHIHGVMHILMHNLAMEMHTFDTKFSITLSDNSSTSQNDTTSTSSTNNSSTSSANASSTTSTGTTSSQSASSDTSSSSSTSAETTTDSSTSTNTSNTSETSTSTSNDTSSQTSDTTSSADAETTNTSTLKTSILRSIFQIAIISFPVILGF